MKLTANWNKIVSFNSFKDFINNYKNDKSLNFICKWVDPVKKQVALNINGPFKNKKDAMKYLKNTSKNLDFFSFAKSDPLDVNAIDKWNLSVDVIPRSKAEKFFENLFNNKYIPQGFKIYML